MRQHEIKTISLVRSAEQAEASDSNDPGNANSALQQVQPAPDELVQSQSNDRSVRSGPQWIVIIALMVYVLSVAFWHR
jgi:hypothetical protein